MVLVKEELKMHLWNVISICREQTGIPSTLIMAALSEISLEIKSDEMTEMLAEVRNDQENQAGEGRGEAVKRDEKGIEG